MRRLIILKLFLLSFRTATSTGPGPVLIPCTPSPTDSQELDCDCNGAACIAGRLCNNNVCSNAALPPCQQKDTPLTAACQCGKGPCQAASTCAGTNQCRVGGGGPPGPQPCAQSPTPLQAACLCGTAQCNVGQVCSNNQCIDACQPAPTVAVRVCQCGTAATCQIGQVCQNGQCVQPPQQCTPSPNPLTAACQCNNAQCQVGQICNYGANGLQCTNAPPRCPTASAATQECICGTGTSTIRCQTGQTCQTTPSLQCVTGGGGGNGRVDTASNCASTAALCNNAIYRDILARYCPATCAIRAQNCRDSNSNCPMWNRRGFCTSPFYSSQRSMCSLTCGLC